MNKIDIHVHSNPSLDPSTGQALGWTGIDTVRVWTPVPAGADLPGGSPTYGPDDVDDVTGQVTNRLLSSHAYLSGIRVQISHNFFPSRLTWELSIPKRAWGHNVVPATVAEVIEVEATLLREIGDLVGISIPVAELRVSRVDFVRDFLVPQPGRLLDSLERRPRTLAKRGAAKFSAGGVTTGLHAGTSGQWAAAVYDKATEVGSKHEPSPEVTALAEGRLRFEVSLRTGPLKRRNITTIGSLTDTSVATICREQWDGLGWGAQVATASTWTERLDAAYETAGSELEAALGDLLLTRAGRPSRKSRNTRARYRAVLQDSGIDASLLTAPGGVSGHLDYDQGAFVPSRTPERATP